MKPVSEMVIFSSGSETIPKEVLGSCNECMPITEDSFKKTSKEFGEPFTKSNFERTLLIFSTENWAINNFYVYLYVNEVVVGIKFTNGTNSHVRSHVMKKLSEYLNDEAFCSYTDGECVFLGEFE